jgi:NAD(P)-dependent dehydrogenase (short-subunit alcohol dehydrogenase family)
MYATSTRRPWERSARTAKFLRRLARFPNKQTRIGINAILPGLVEGPRMTRVIEARAKALGIGFEEMKDTYLKKISLRRMVSETDVAALALFLASPAARNITGQSISVDANVEFL